MEITRRRESNYQFTIQDSRARHVPLYCIIACGHRVSYNSADPDDDTGVYTAPSTYSGVVAPQNLDGVCVHHTQHVWLENPSVRIYALMIRSVDQETKTSIADPMFGSDFSLVGGRVFRFYISLEVSGWWQTTFVRWGVG